MRKYFLFAVTRSVIAESLTGTRKSKRFFSVSCVALILAAVLSVTPANARIATTESGTRVVVAKPFNDVSVNVCNVHYNVEQRMIINGHSMMVLAQSPYDVGPHDLILIETCEGYNIYDLSGCNCLTVDFPDPSITNDAENTSTEITKPGPMQLITTHKTTGFLWIRKEK